MIIPALKQIKFHLIMWTFLFLSLIPLTIVIISQIFRAKKIEIYITKFITKIYGKITMFGTGSTVTIFGKENIPKNKNVCYISNHQSNFDIPTILGSVNNEIGFLAKNSLIMFPIVGLWMKFMGCIFIDRSNLKGSIKTIKKELKTIINGRPILVFPEGTRSKSNNIGEFQPGTIRILGKINDIEIIPITVKNTYKAFEEHHGAASANIEIYFHKAIHTNSLQKDDIKDLTKRLKNIIKKPLTA